MGSLEYSGGIGLLLLLGILIWVWDTLVGEGPIAALKLVLVIFGWVLKYVALVLGLLGTVVGSMFLFSKLPFAQDYPSIKAIVGLLVGGALFVKIGDFLAKKKQTSKEER